MSRAAIMELREYDAAVPQSVALTVIAQDPSVKTREGILTAKLQIPAEYLAPGPRGARFHVVDYDATTGELSPPVALDPEQGDHFAGASDATLTSDPGFRAQNVYAVAARTLATFEAALGRRLDWAAKGHQLYLVPRAFAEANAYYAPEDGAIYFGYLPLDNAEEVQTALSHDVVAHETTHAVLDGLCPRFAEPGLPDQPAFHEALGDIVALLSVFSMGEVVERLLGDADAHGRIPRRELERGRLAASALLGLAEELGSALSGARGSALRRSVALEPSAAWRSDRAFIEPHRRAEVLVAAVTQTLLRMWTERLVALASERGADRSRVAEEGAKAADHLLRMIIRGIDYMPPVELEFEDVLDSVLKADEVLAPDDAHGYRGALTDAFAAFDIHPTPGGVVDLTELGAPRYERMNFTSMRSDTDEVFRFIWENAQILGITREWRLRVESVRPSIRVGPDGLIVPEVVAAYIQTLELTAREFEARGKCKLAAPADTQLQLWGGGALIFDQFGRAKFHQEKRLSDWARQARRLEYLIGERLHDSRGRYGFTLSIPHGQRFAAMHIADQRAEENW